MRILCIQTVSHVIAVKILQILKLNNSLVEYIHKRNEMGFLKNHIQICTTKETINVTQLIHRYLALPKWFNLLVLINKYIYYPLFYLFFSLPL